MAAEHKKSTARGDWPLEPLMGRINRCFEGAVDGCGLYLFRILYGFILAFWAWDYLTSGRVTSIYIEPNYHFSYRGLEWIKPLPGFWMYGVFSLLLLASLGIALGFFYRTSALTFAIGFTYLFFCERTNYQNHYYLLIWFSWWLPWMPLDRGWSLGAVLSGSTQWRVPAWCLTMLRFHIAIPYFMGGVAKLEPDWLTGAPVRQMLQSLQHWPVVGGTLNQESTVFLIAWGGLVFDLAIVPMLLVRKTRMLAYGAACLFHLTNAVLFQIHIFPWLMIAATTLFFPTSWPRHFFGLPTEGEEPERSRGIGISSVAKWIIGLYVAFHLVFPLRSVFYSEETSWTERGHYFAWRMMLRGKITGVRYYLTDEKIGATWIASLQRWITLEQASRFARDPDMILQLGQFLGDHYYASTGRIAKVQVLALSSLNGRKAQLLIDPKCDLMSIDPWELGRQWVVPLSEPLRVPPWQVPLEQWEKFVSLPDLPVPNSKEPSLMDRAIFYRQARRPAISEGGADR